MEIWSEWKYSAKEDDYRGDDHISVDLDQNALFVSELDGKSIPFQSWWCPI